MSLQKLGTVYPCRSLSCSNRFGSEKNCSKVQYLSSMFGSRLHENQRLVLVCDQLAFNTDFYSIAHLSKYSPSFLLNFLLYDFQANFSKKEPFTLFVQKGIVATSAELISLIYDILV